MRSTMNISLPEPLKRWVEKQVEKGGFSTASEYVRDVLRREKIVETRSQIDQHLIASLNSGTAIDYDPASLRGKANASAGNKRAA